MLGRIGVSAAALMALACTAGGSGVRDGGPRMDAARDAGARDSGPETCANSAECDDGFACTLDECVIGNVCRHDPLDVRCNEGEVCVVGRGCVTGMPTECSSPADCDDGRPCNGTENCLRNTCIPGVAIVCNDGNACTEDVCDDGAGGCRYDPICDSGTRLDAGPPCLTFDPASHYAGTFLMLPSQTCGGGGGSYSVDTLGFAVSGGTLTVSAGPFTLTQSPAPTGASFDVSGSNGCANVRITGTFACSNRFTATWSATHTGGCAACAFTSSAVEGVR